MSPFPFLDRIEQSNRVLLAGAGGGYDVFAALPIYFHLRQLGKQVELANLSFSPVWEMEGERIGPEVLTVNGETQSSNPYFPEKFLCQWFQESLNEQICIYSFARTGAKLVAESYDALMQEREFDAIVLVDGGTDSLMRGDEYSLATPEEDIASINAVHRLDLEEKYLVCIGFGIDKFHGINHSQFLEAVADLTTSGSFLGTCSLLPDSKEFQLYREACQFVFGKMPHHPSIVNASILSAIEGHFGDYHATERTAGSELWINPLMGIYWAFQLDAVANRCLYLDQIAETETYMDLSIRIGAFRESLAATRGWDSIPV